MKESCLISLRYSLSLSTPASSVICNVLSPSLPPSLPVKVVETLTTQPLESLCPSHKVQVLAALVNEIMASPDLCREVDIRMEQIASFRREKWKINLKLKRWALYGICGGHKAFCSDIVREIVKKWSGPP